MTRIFPKRLRIHLRWQYVIEIIAVIVFAVLVAQEYTRFNPNLRLAGGESEWLTSSATYAAEIFQETGRLPWWQPYLSHGQPAIDEAFSFVANPFSILPSLLLGAQMGLQITVILFFVIAGLGGWFLGWTLNWGFLGRVLLALLLILKGNMQSSIGMGFFQLGGTQAYFPWVIAGALAIPRYPDRRWPQVLFAVSFSLMFFAGNIYYTLPMAMLTALVVIIYGMKIRLNNFAIKFDTKLLWRYLVAVLLTAGLMAFTALTILFNYELLGRHPDHGIWNPIDLGQGLFQFVNAEVLEQGARFGNSYTFVSPLWFIVLLFVLIPPIKLLHQYAKPGDWRLWLIGLIGLVWFALWGMGINPIIIWMYENLPLIGQWRFPERMLSVASFLFAFLIAFRVDGLQRVLMSIDYDRVKTGRLTQKLVFLAFAVACGIAVLEVNQTRDPFGYFESYDYNIEQCVRFLRERYPNEWLAVLKREYVTMTTYMQNRVRMSLLTADYDLNGLPSEIYPFDLSEALPEFRLASWYEEPAWLESDGYVPIEGSPMVDPYSTLPCVWHKQDALGYVFSASLADVQSQTEVFDASITTRIDDFERTPEYIAMVAMPLADEESVVVAQDIAYPGWTVKVNGEPAKLESVGRLMGVILPPGDQPTLIEFQYTAPTLRIGALITLVAIVICAGYLLRAETIPARVRAYREARKLASSQKPVQQKPVPVPAPSMAAMPVVSQSQSVELAQPVPQSRTGKPALIRTITPVYDTDKTLQPTLEVRVSSGRHRVVLPPSDEPLVVEVVVEKPRWSGIGTLMSILAAGLIGANVMRLFSRNGREKG